MLKITLPKGSTVEVTDAPDGVKVLRMSGPHGQGELRLDAESAREVGLAFMPHPEGRKTQATLCDEHKAQYFESGYKAALSEGKSQANLGLAFTRELLVELEVRYRIGLAGIPTPDEEWMAAGLRSIINQSTEEQLDYRTIDHG
jgi:hypothetical protein